MDACAHCDIIFHSLYLGLTNVSTFTRYENASLSGQTISSLLYLHTNDAVGSTSMIKLLQGPYKEDTCLIECWESMDCYAIQVVYDQSPGGSFDSVKWCMLLRVGTDGANVTSHNEAGSETALTRIQQWATSSASHVTELQNTNVYKTSWDTAVIVKGMPYQT